MSLREQIDKRIRRSPGEFHASACLGKHGFETRTVAERVAKKKPKANLSVYLCPFCQLYHIGSRHRARS